MLMRKTNAPQNQPFMIDISKAEKDALFHKELLPHIDSVYSFAFRLTMDEHEAQDLVQETFLKAYRFWDGYQQGTNAKAWLFTILKNTFINDFRKKSREPYKLSYDQPEAYFGVNNFKGNALTTVLDGASGILGDEITLALQSLDPDHKLIVVLADLEDFKYDEIASILDIPIGTVRSRLHRGRHLLKDALAKYASKMGYSEAKKHLAG